jgi:hypothetical protein
VNGWLTAADRFIPGLNDATGGRDADWFTGVLVNHCRANPSLTIADALEQIINNRFPRLFPVPNVSQHCNKRHARKAASR